MTLKSIPILSLVFCCFLSSAAFAQGKGSDSDLYRQRKEREREKEKQRRENPDQANQGLPIDLIYSAALNAGDNEKPLASGGVKAGLTVRKKSKHKDSSELVKKSNEKTTFSLEVQGGNPVVRFGGQLDVYPIEVFSHFIPHEASQSQEGLEKDPQGILQVLIQPLSVQGFASIDRFNKFRDQDVWGKTTFTATPEFIVRSLGEVFQSKGGDSPLQIQLEVGISAGPSAGYTSDADGESAIVGSQLGFIFSPTVLLDARNALELKLTGSYTLNLVGQAGNLSRINSEINYLHRFGDGNLELFVGGFGKFEKIDVPNHIRTLEKDNGETYFIGGQLGVHWANP